MRPGSHARLTTLVDESDLIGLGDVVDAHGLITPEAIQQVVDSLHRLQSLSEQAGASRLVVMGTEPLRRATNTDELLAAIERYTGLQAVVLAVRQEAELTFIGVTGARTPRRALATVDIGGGSTEVALHAPGHELVIIPLPVGSSRLTNAHVRNDPPSRLELDALIDAAREAVFAADWPDHMGAIRSALFVGGTATNIARLGQLDRAHLNEDLDTLARMPAADVVDHFGVRPRRARQLAAGVAIVSALLDRFLLGRADVSDASLRDGAVLCALARGDDWLTAIDEMIAGAQPASESTHILSEPSAARSA